VTESGGDGLNSYLTSKSDDKGAQEVDQRAVLPSSWCVSFDFVKGGRERCGSCVTDPANVSHSGKFVVRVEVEDIFNSRGGTEEVTSCGVNDALWLSCGS
jgi:hypothetical protein